MNKKIIGILICTLLISNILPALGLAENNEIKVGKPTLNEANEISTSKCNVYDGISKRITRYHLSAEETQRIIGLIQDGISHESYSKQIEEKLKVLIDIGIIEPEIAYKLINIFKSKERSFIQRNSIINKVQLFEVVNVFSGVFFGLKGVKDHTLYELIQFAIPFLIGNMTAGFTVLYKFTGNGSIFSIGFLGIKSIHEYDPSKYEDPYLPVISGSIIGFTGILIEVDAAETYKYYIGAGTNIATIWSKLS
jgi:hypothetical protein